MPALVIRDPNLRTFGGIVEAFSQLLKQQGAEKVLKEMADVPLNPGLDGIFITILKRAGVEFITT